jgi:hypothetical protein
MSTSVAEIREAEALPPISEPPGGSVIARVLARSLVALSMQVFDLSRWNADYSLM